MSSDALPTNLHTNNVYLISQVFKFMLEHASAYEMPFSPLLLALLRVNSFLDFQGIFLPW
jgi:hypothetical protein